MDIKPLGGRVVVELIQNNEQTTKSGIVLPDSAEKKEQSKGIVTAVGPGKIQNGARIAPEVKVGDKVIFSKPWGDDKKMEEGEKTYFIVEEDDILAIIN
jgi:chaperonin GroES